MHKLRRLAARMAPVYTQMSEVFGEFQNSSGLSCSSECGACCLAPTIEASPLEMLPMALELFDRGLAETTLTSIEEAPSNQCIFYKKLSFDGTKGRCTTYETRPTLCRVFGVAARKNKLGLKELSVCKVLKTEKSDVLTGLTQEDIMRAPLMSEWKGLIATMGEILPTYDLPINQALKIAIEKVLLTSLYSPDDDYPDETTNQAM